MSTVCTGVCALNVIDNWLAWATNCIGICYSCFIYRELLQRLYTVLLVLAFLSIGQLVDHIAFMSKPQLEVCVKHRSAKNHGQKETLLGDLQTPLESI